MNEDGRSERNSPISDLCDRFRSIYKLPQISYLAERKIWVWAKIQLKSIAKNCYPFYWHDWFWNGNQLSNNIVCKSFHAYFNMHFIDQFSFLLFSDHSQYNSSSILSFQCLPSLYSKCHKHRVESLPVRVGRWCRARYPHREPYDPRTQYPSVRER